MTRYKTRTINITYCLSKRRQRCETDSWWQTVPRIYNTLSKKFCRTPLVHWRLNSLYACPRVVVVKLYSKKSLKLTETPIQKTIFSRTLFLMELLYIVAVWPVIDGPSPRCQRPIDQWRKIIDLQIITNSRTLRELLGPPKSITHVVP